MSKKEESPPDLYQNSVFQKIMPFLDSYMKCKLRLQQLRQSGDSIPAIEQSVKYNIKFYAGRIKEIISEDSENTTK